MTDRELMQQPEALRLAEMIEEDMSCIGDKEIAAELRRLHEVNAELLEAVKAALSDDQPYIERCKAALIKATGEQQ